MKFSKVKISKSNDFMINLSQLDSKLGFRKIVTIETNLKGVDLSEKVGFSNYNYFYIVFKKITGQKPMEIRNTK